LNKCRRDSPIARGIEGGIKSKLEKENQGPLVEIIRSNRISTNWLG